MSIPTIAFSTETCWAGTAKGLPTGVQSQQQIQIFQEVLLMDTKIAPTLESATLFWEACGFQQNLLQQKNKFHFEQKKHLYWNIEQKNSFDYL